MRVKCSYEDYDGDHCKHRGSDGYCTLGEISIDCGIEGVPCCQEEDVE